MAAATPMATPSFQVGDRVLVMGKLAGAVRFIGQTKFADGEWFGIALDEEKGKNDGTVQDVQYFTCDPMKGMFVRHNHLQPEQPAANGKRVSKMGGKKNSVLAKPRRKSSGTPSSVAAVDSSAADHPSSPSSPSGSPTSKQGWNRRHSNQFETTTINIDANEELIETVRSCAGEVARLEEVMKSLSVSLNDAAVHETVCAAPAALFSGGEMPDLTSELEILLGEATSRLEQRLQEKLNDSLEEQLREALAPRIEELQSRGD